MFIVKSANPLYGKLKIRVQTSSNFLHETINSDEFFEHIVESMDGIYTDELFADVHDDEIIFEWAFDTDDGISFDTVLAQFRTALNEWEIKGDSFSVDKLLGKSIRILAGQHDGDYGKLIPIPRDNTNVILSTPYGLEQISKDEIVYAEEIEDW